MVATHELGYKGTMPRAAHAHAARFYGAVLVSVLAVAAVVVLRSRSPAGPRPAVAASERPDAALVAWCAPGLEPIAGGGCFALGLEVSTPRALLVYLHGRYAPENEADELERRCGIRLSTWLPPCNLQSVETRKQRTRRPCLALLDHLEVCNGSEFRSSLEFPDPFHSDAFFIVRFVVRFVFGV